MTRFGAKRGVVSGGVLLLAVVIASVLHHYRSTAVPVKRSAAPMSDEPRTMLWAWETPQDLRTLDPSRAGVAFLAREIVLGRRVTVRPRLQPLSVPEGTWMMAVVRLEPAPSFQATPALRTEAALAILDTLSRPGVRALQIDFDATASQRDFYADLLREVHRALPAGVPLSMTALVSWCGAGSWLTSLPSGPLLVDEAVPMFFRMGGPAAARAARARDVAEITAPVCAGSVGVSTDEAWPRVRSEQRVYIFHPQPWHPSEIATLNRLGYGGLHESPR